MTRPRVLAFTPGPPLRSGGAVYAGSLLPALAQHLDVVAVSPVPVEWDGPTSRPEAVRPDPDRDVLLHFLADSHEHLFAYRSALRWGGVAVCHELMFPHLLGTFAPDEELLDLVDHLGPERAAAFRRRRAEGVASHREVYLLQVLSRPIRRAEAVVVHSRFAKFALEAELPGVAVHHVPSHTGAVPPDVSATHRARARLKLEPESFYVGLFGHLGGHKRVAEALAAIASAVPALRARNVDLRLLVVGSEVATDIPALVAARDLEHVTTFRWGPDDGAFFEHMAAVDVTVNLRYPTLGETSATLIQAMSLGKPVITTDHAQFGEEVAAVRIPPDDSEGDGIRRALITLATCAGCRTRVAEAGRRRAAASRIGAAAAAYLAAIESVLRQRSARHAAVVPDRT